jgi:dTDP-4-dehydrorhamnose reductase
MTSARSVLLLGASGFFGPALAHALAPRPTVCTYSKNAIAGGVHFDARRSDVAALLDALPEPPGAAVILFGETNIDACARDPAGTAALNVEGAKRAIGEVHARGILPVYLSSDAVFDGTRALWKEDDDARPVLEYGRQKRDVERFVAALPPPWLMVRLPKLLAEPADKRCMVTQWLTALGREGRILCATDQFFTPLAAADAAGAIALLVNQRAQGLYHLGGPERLSRRALLQSVLEVYRGAATPRAEIVDCRLADVPFFEPRPLDTSMSTQRFAARHAFPLRAASEVARGAARAFLAGGTVR